MKHYHKNPRQITKKQYEQLQKWLEEYGDLSGIVHNVRTDEIIGGNQRAEAMGFLQDETKPAIEHKFKKPTKQGTVASGYFEYHGERFQYRQVDWPPRKAEAANVIANKAGGGWDYDILANEFEVGDLLNWGFEEYELVGAGFDMEEESQDAEPQIDKANELLKKWKVKSGDLFAVGNHKLLCGDCTKREDVERAMGGEMADFSFTDPPYNVGIKYGEGTNDNQGKQQFIAWCHGWTQYLPKRHLLTVGIKRLVWWGEILGDPQWIIAWIKRNGQGQTGLGGTNKWDAILVYGVEQDHKTDIIELNNDYSENIKAEGCHPTAKPVRLWQQVIERFNGHVVYEPFGGSGTTMVACNNLGRKCRTIEIDPKYCAVILQRMQDAFPDIVIKKL